MMEKGEASKHSVGVAITCTSHLMLRNWNLTFLVVRPTDLNRNCTWMLTEYLLENGKNQIVLGTSFDSLYMFSRAPM